MPSEIEHDIVDKVSELLMDVMSLAKPPHAPEGWASVDSFKTLYANLLSLREFLHAASNGDLSKQVTFKGFVGGTLKTLRANLRHMTWQTQMVASGDFTQRVEFMGEFSRSFNAMVDQLDRTLKDLVASKTELSAANKNLLTEVTMRRQMEAALRESEEALRLLATTDPLTGLYNRRHFNDLAEEEVSRAIRYGRPMSVVMFDIDHFKKVNDGYGHHAGDVVLKEIAALTQNTVRPTDIPARFGGEEFILLLPETSLGKATAAAERLRSRIEGTAIQTEKGTLRITASFGVSDFLREDSSKSPEAILTKLVASADQALYESKNAGRNRVTVNKHGCNLSAGKAGSHPSSS